MLVHGDAKRREGAAAMLRNVRDLLLGAFAAPRGLERHSTLVAALIEAGELAQGVADAAFRAAGERDAATLAGDAAMALVVEVARCCGTSWASGFEQDGAFPAAAYAQCIALLADEPLEISRPEGYAYYALYPESYFEAARHAAAARGPGDPVDWRVVGLRSIGTSLAAMVAAGLQAPLPRTLRPVGHPYDRQVCSTPPRPADLAAAHAVVDEGPGRSGSTLAAAARWLEQAGVPTDRLHLFVSHDQGPGAEASPATRALWARAPCHVVTFDALILDAARPAHRLDHWVAAVVGALGAPLRDLGGGAWRALQHRSGALPPAHPWQERRKFLAESASGRWLVKYCGLGREGLEKLARARTLAAAGFTPQPAGVCHGFLVERWRDDLLPLTWPWSGADRTALVEHVGAYLGLRARCFPARPGSGATLAQLLEMGRHNSAEEFGSGAAAAWAHRETGLDALEARVRPVYTDNRMQSWEWLAGDGALLKTDALDHASGHDLVGCQDIAWDVVGAGVEFALDESEVRHLATRTAAHSGHPVDEALCEFLRPCYLAFQLGAWREAQAAVGDAVEAARLRAAADRYAAGLRAALGRPRCA